MMMGGLNFNVELTNPLPETYCTAVNAIFSPAGLLSRLKLAQRELKASRPLSSFFAGDLLELRLVLF